MLEQLKTIREALRHGIKAINSLGGACEAMPLHDAMPALIQLEAMAGGQAAVTQQPSKATLEKLRAWRTNGELIDRAWQVLQSQEQEIMRLEKMLAEKRDQQADTVPSSDLNPDEGDPVTLWAEIWRLREAVKGPDGYATWQDAATAERIRRVRAESKHAAPVAQQPQARPDFNDEWTGYLKDGETPFERFLRERKDVQSVLKLYQRALEENERLKAQQPQAEAKVVYRLAETDIYDFAGWLTTRPGVMEVGSSKEAGPMAEAVGEYLRAYPERFAPQQAEAAPEMHDALCPALTGGDCTCTPPATIDKAWAQFCGGIGRGPDAPYPGMIEAFEAHYGQTFTDKDWREETGVWAAAWKAAKAHELFDPVMVDSLLAKMLSDVAIDAAIAQQKGQS